MTIIDGPTGTVLIDRLGPPPGEVREQWSAWYIRHAPEALAALHAEYAAAGATVHRACTFRAQPRLCGDRYIELVREAVQIARRSVPAGQLIVGSLGPVMDCYRPELSPPDEDALAAHSGMAHALASAGVDAILCETFPSVREGLLAVRAATETDLPIWVSFTAGPAAGLMTPVEMANAARHAADLGASACFVGCTPARVCEDYIAPMKEALRSTQRVDVGVLANAGDPVEQLGWSAEPTQAAVRIVELAKRWQQAGTTFLGSCCGTGPAHTRALAQAFGTTKTQQARP